MSVVNPSAQSDAGGVPGARPLTERQVFLFSALCCLVYFTSYVTRYNYGAAIPELVNSLHLSNQLVSMGVLGSFVTYGTGQLVFGILGDRIEPRSMIFAGLALSALCNMGIALTNSIYAMAFIWSCNGLFQAMIWPPLLRIMARTLSAESYRKASVGVVAASSIGTIAVYLFVPLCIWMSGWRLSFALPAVFGLAAAIVWFFGVKRFARRVDIPGDESHGQQPLVNVRSIIFAAGLLPIFCVIVFQGALRDGIATWMPSYIHDVFQFDTSVSILSGAVLPIFTILSVTLANWVYRLIRNELKCAAYLWAVGFAASVALLFMFASSAAVTVLLMAIISGCMHGVNLMLISILPLRFKKYGRISTVSGILNALTYLGSALSAYGIAAVSDYFGWKHTVLSWVVLTFFGMAMCAASVKQRKHQWQ